MTARGWGPEGTGFGAFVLNGWGQKGGGGSGVFLWSGTGFDVGLGANVLKNRARSKNSCIHEHLSYREVGCS